MPHFFAQGLCGRPPWRSLRGCRIGVAIAAIVILLFGSLLLVLMAMLLGQAPRRRLAGCSRRSPYPPCWWSTRSISDTGPPMDREDGALRLTHDAGRDAAKHRAYYPVNARVLTVGRRLGLIHLSSDVVRKSLAGLPPRAINRKCSSTACTAAA
jgi:hypothetical protein